MTNLTRNHTIRLAAGDQGSWSTKTPLPNPVKTYLLVSVGPGAGSWGIHSFSRSSPSYFVLCHSRCLAQRRHDPYPHESSHFVLVCHSIGLAYMAPKISFHFSLSPSFSTSSYFIIPLALSCLLRPWHTQDMATELWQIGAISNNHQCSLNPMLMLLLLILLSVLLLLLLLLLLAYPGHGHRTMADRCS